MAAPIPLRPRDQRIVAERFMQSADLQVESSVRIASLRVAVVAALAAVMLTRILGPTDLWHQTQPRTISYTVDMLVNGGRSWLLPLDFGGVPATKPLMVNWLAAPFVALFGRGSEIAHKLPSLVALAVTTVLLARFGRRAGPGVGWLAALMCLTTYPFFKLGYLARPDMVLVAFLLGAWWSGTELLLERARRVALSRVTFWTCVTGAALTKGPVAILPILYVVAGSKLVAGSWGAMTRVGPLGAVPALAVIGAYYAALWQLDAHHVMAVLVGDEVIGRVTGESVGLAPPEVLREVLLGPLKMPGYFVVRFFPWCVPAIIGAVDVIARRRRGDTAVPRTLVAALVWSLCVVVPFSLAAGKRADYIAPAYPAMALVGAWWILNQETWPWLWKTVLPTAAVALAVLVIANELVMEQPRDTVLEVETITERLERAAAEQRDPPLVSFNPIMMSHLAAVAGTGRPCESSEANILDALRAGRPLRIAYVDEELTDELRAELEDADMRGLIHQVWRSPMRWRRDGDVLTVNFHFVEVRPTGAAEDR